MTRINAIRVSTERSICQQSITIGNTIFESFHECFDDSFERVGVMTSRYEKKCGLLTGLTNIYFGRLD